jgi:hypothetical protein
MANNERCAFWHPSKLQYRTHVTQTRNHILLRYLTVNTKKGIDYTHQELVWISKSSLRGTPAVNMIPNHDGNA